MSVTNALVGARASSDPQVWPGHAPVPPYETPMYLIGRKGLNLVDAIFDLDVQELSRMVNVTSTYGSPLTVRPGQTGIGTTAAARVHSLFRLNDPNASAFTRLAGVSTDLYRGTTGAYASVDSGYSGDPLTFTGVNMPLSGTPYAVISDRSRQRKISRTGAIEVFGIPPAALTSTALVTQPLFTSIADFAASDGTQAASWTATAGQDRSTPPNASGAPVLADVAGPHVAMTTTVGGALTGYDNIMSIAKAINLDAGATDDDHTRIQFNVSDPQWLEELKVYFVVSTVFTAGAIPGNSAFNQDAYFKSFRPSDMQDYFERSQSGLDASDDLRLRTLMEQFKDQQVHDTRGTLVNTTAVTDLTRQAIPSIGAGRNIWSIFGEAGFPLRRGEWQRIRGVEFSRTWANVTGIVIVAQTNTPNPITFTFGAGAATAGWRLYGGSGPDNSDPGASGYDVRVINYNPSTGSKGNPSAEQAATAFLNALRQPIRVTPTASGTAALRQQAYLRGGSAVGTQDWFFAGQNASDGGTIDITVGDDERITEETLELDNDQPVTSVNTSGVTVLNQTLPIYFAVEDYLFGLGDPLQPGRLYRSKQGEVEQWPPNSYQDVCAATEELMNGGQIASTGFCFSRNRLYTILISADGEFTTEPSACNEGLVSRWAMAVTPFGIAFVSPFGVRLTTGGAPERLSDEMIEPLFKGETIRGLSPIDLAVPTALQLAYYDDELWMTYADTGGVRRHLIYNFFDKAWRSYLFAETVSTVYGEPVQGAAASLLLGGNSTGQVYTHSGFTDDGAAIAYSFRTGAFDFNNPRNEKQLAEVVLDADLEAGTISVGPFLDDEDVTVTAQTVTGTAAPDRYIFEPFGTDPQRARNVAIDISGNAPTGARPSFGRLGVTHQLQPEITMNEPSPWEEMPGGEGYVWGVLITCDTGGTARTVEVEYTTNNGSITSAATLSVTATGRRKLPFTWSAVLAQQIRLRPTGSCLAWIRYKIEWLSDPEPPRVLGWNSNWENFGTFADKWLKGYLIEADTFNAAKTVVIDSVDSSSVQQLGVQSNSLTFNGRGVQHIAFTKIRGRLFRMRATDANFGKFYRWQPIFDQEPLALTRWQTQERPHEGMDGKWQKPMEALLSIRSSGTVTLQITTFGYSGTTLNTSSYNIASTAGAKQKVRVPLNPVKGLLFEYLFTAGAGFWLYKEESELLVEDWVTGVAKWCPLPSSNDDLDPARAMGVASVAAATPGGA